MFSFTFTRWHKLILPNKYLQRIKESDGKNSRDLDLSPLTAWKQVLYHVIIIGIFLAINPYGLWFGPLVYNQIMFMNGIIGRKDKLDSDTCNQILKDADSSCVIRMDAGTEGSLLIRRHIPTTNSDHALHSDTVLFHETHCHYQLWPCLSGQKIQCYFISSHTVWQVSIAVTTLQEDKYSSKPHS